LLKFEDESKKIYWKFSEEKINFKKENTQRTHQVSDLRRKFNKDNNNDDMTSRKQIHKINPSSNN
jgi:hypothetical protein